MSGLALFLSIYCILAGTVLSQWLKEVEEGKVSSKKVALVFFSTSNTTASNSSSAFPHQWYPRCNLCYNSMSNFDSGHNFTERWIWENRG